MAKPIVALFRNTFLPYSETFIYKSLSFYDSFTPIVVTKKRINQELFPFHPVIVPRDLTRPGFVEHFLFSIGVTAPALSQKFRSHRPNILHTHFAQSSILAIPYAKKFNIPLLVSLHGNDVGILLGRQKFLPKWWFYRISFRRIVNNTTLFLAASTDLQQRFVELGCPPAKVKVHRLGIDLDEFRISPDKSNPRKNVIVMIGRLVEKKGFEYGIKAFAGAINKIKNQHPTDIKLDVIGEGPLESKLKHLVKELGVSDYIDFPGRKSPREVSQYLQREATILMCPSVVAANKDRDSGLIVAKEAAACGIPVIGTFHGGIPEIVENNKTGFLVPERDHGALTECLVKILTGGRIQEKFGRAARFKMETDYNIKKQMLELEAIYADTIQLFNKY